QIQRAVEIDKESRLRIGQLSRNKIGRNAGVKRRCGIVIVVKGFKHNGIYTGGGNIADRVVSHIELISNSAEHAPLEREHILRDIERNRWFSADNLTTGGRQRI